LTVLYAIFNKQLNGKIVSTVDPEIIESAEAKLCSALLVYTEEKRSSTALNQMIKELEQVEFAKQISKITKY